MGTERILLGILIFTAFIMSGCKVFAKEGVSSVVLTIASEYYGIASPDGHITGEGNLEDFCNSTPLFKDNRIYVPARFLVEVFGGNIGWDKESKRAVLFLDGKEALLAPGDKSAVVDGQAQTMACAPFISSNELLVPLRDVAEYLGLTVVWIRDDRSVEISKTRITYETEDVRKKVNELDMKAFNVIRQKLIDVHQEHSENGVAALWTALVDMHFMDIKSADISNGKGALVVYVRYAPIGNPGYSSILMVLAREPEYSVRYMAQSHEFAFSTHDIDSDGSEEVFVDESYSYKSAERNLKVLKYEGSSFKTIFSGGYSYIPLRTWYESDFSYSLIPNGRDNKLSDIVFSISNKEIDHEGDTFIDSRPYRDLSYPLTDSITFTYDGSLYVPNKSVGGYSNFTFAAYDLKYSPVLVESLERITLDKSCTNVKNIHCEDMTIRFYYLTNEVERGILGVLEYKGSLYDLVFFKGSGYFDYETIQDYVVTMANLDFVKGNDVVLIFTGEGTNAGNTIAVGIGKDGKPVKFATAWNLKMAGHDAMEQAVSTDYGVNTRKLSLYAWNSGNKCFEALDINRSTGYNYASLLELESGYDECVIELGNYDSTASKIENIRSLKYSEGRLLFM